MRPIVTVFLLCIAPIHLATAGDKKRSFDELLKGLSDKDASARHKATLELRAHGSNARLAIPALTKAVEDDDPKVRRTAVLSLRFIATDCNIVDVTQAANNLKEIAAAVKSAADLAKKQGKKLAPKDLTDAFAAVKKLEATGRQMQQTWKAMKAITRALDESKLAEESKTETQKQTESMLKALALLQKSNRELQTVVIEAEKDSPAAIDELRKAIREAERPFEMVLSD